MASPEVLDFERLLAPIGGENPAGRALREDFSPTSVYHQIKDARNTARAAERNVVWEEDGSTSESADWSAVLDLCPTVIAEESKDLEVAAFLSEALIRQHGMAGLRDAFRLLRELSQAFWDNLYPLPDEDGIITRVAPVAGLNGEDGVLIQPIANAPLTAAGTYQPLTGADYVQATELERLSDPDIRSQRIDRGAVTMQMFEKAVLETPPEFYRNLADDAAACVEEFGRLCETMDELCGQGDDGYSLAPPSSNIRNALENVQQNIRSVAGHLLDDEAGSEGDQEAADAEVTALVETKSAAPMGPVQTRDEAFRALRKVAEFFKRTEPHSPVSYALEQAVRWGKMPLPELLTELITEESAREQLFKLVGIPMPEEESD